MATFTEDFTRMRQECDNSRAERRQLVQDNCEYVQNLAHSTRQDLKRMHDETAEMADKLRTELKDLSTDLSTGGGIFRKESKAKKGR
jgi:uncharacterized membrane-anchored protein YhcB (DUF1043 family)